MSTIPASVALQASGHVESFVARSCGAPAEQLSAVGGVGRIFLADRDAGAYDPAGDHALCAHGMVVSETSVRAHSVQCTESRLIASAGVLVRPTAHWATHGLSARAQYMYPAEPWQRHSALRLRKLQRHPGQQVVGRQ